MGITFQVDTTPFATLGPTAGRKAKECYPGSPRQVIHRFHVPGTTGNLKIFGGTEGQVIRLLARYQEASVGALTTLLKTDRAAWSQADVDVVDDEGTTHTRCTLRTMQRRGPIKHIGRSLVAVDVELVFDCDSA